MSQQKVGHVILVRFRVKAGQERDFVKRMHAVIPETRKQPGNRQFEFYVDQADPQNFMLYEEFADLAAAQAHQARPVMGDHMAAIKPMFDAPPDMSLWTQALTNADQDGHRPEAVGHVTLVRFRMKADGVEPMLAAVGGDLDHMQGNIRFDLNRSQNDPLDAMICARWVSRAVWEAHNAQPEFSTFVARTAPCLDTPMQRSLWKPAAA